jgi:dihydroorotase
MLQSVIAHSSANFSRAIIMPNLSPPVVTGAQANAYFERIQAAIPEDHDFQPLMTLYLTDGTSANDVEKNAASGLVKAVKLYPAGATTNSDSAVCDIENVYPVLERMSEIGLPLLVHGEVTDPDVDIFDREAVFVERVLIPIRKRFPGLKIVMEHVTTQEGINYVISSEDGIAATITTHHLIINRNAYLVGGIKPHYYCLPVAKREKHRLAIRAAAVSGNARIFLGTDSAPHFDNAKETACGCAGIYTSINTLNCLAHIFEEDGALDQFEPFASLNGPRFYGFEPNKRQVRFVKEDDPIAMPEQIAVRNMKITVFDPGFPLYWRCELI